MTVIGAIELPYAFTMLRGKNPYGNPVSKGDRRRNHGHPVCTFEMDATGLNLIISGLRPELYRGGARAQRGGIDLYFSHRERDREALRSIIENCNRLHPAQNVVFRPVPNPSPSVHETGIDLELVHPGMITYLIVGAYSELQSRGSPPVDLLAESRQMPLYLELEAPQVGNRIHLGGRFFTPYYRHTYLIGMTESPPVLNYGFTSWIPFEGEYSHLIQGMLLATLP